MKRSLQHLTELGPCLALCFALAAPMTAVAAEPAGKPTAAAAPTPRAPDGHPDLSGVWVTAQQAALAGSVLGAGAGPPPKGDVKLLLPVRNGILDNLTNDNNIAARSDDNLPKYKPEFWDKVQDLDLHGNKEDPWVNCRPAGVPRLGAPGQIVQSGAQFVFLYPDTFQRSDYRFVPADGRKHMPDIDGTWKGDAVAHWEGDTLVIETVGITEDSWLAGEGYFHTYDMKVTERIRREGDKLTYDVTVEDPNVLLEPWKMETKQLVRNPNPLATVAEGVFCSERDSAHMVGLQRE
jgi:hypothetical protein